MTELSRNSPHIQLDPDTSAKDFRSVVHIYAKRGDYKALETLKTFGSTRKVKSEWKKETTMWKSAFDRSWGDGEGWEGPLYRMLLFPAGLRDDPYTYQYGMWMLPQNRQEKYLKTIKVLMTASAFSARSMLPAHYIKLAITKGTPEIVSFMIKFHPTIAKRFAQYTMSAIREGDHVMVHGDETNPVNIKWNTTRRAILDAVIQGIPGFLARQSARGRKQAQEPLRTHAPFLWFQRALKRHRG